MWDLFKIIGVTISCLIFGLIPEIVMVVIWILVTPTTPFEKILLVGIFAVCGTTACIFFAIIAFAAWAGILQEVL